MICDPCKLAADENAQPSAYIGLEPKLVPHPQDCGCPCQHKPVGAWKGKK